MSYARSLGYGNLITRKELMNFWNITETRMKTMEAEGFTDIALYRVSDVNAYMIAKGIKGLEKLKSQHVRGKTAVKHIPEGTMTRRQLWEKMGIPEGSLTKLEKRGLSAARYPKMLINGENKFCVLYDTEKARQWLKENTKGKYHDI